MLLTGYFSLFNLNGIINYTIADITGIITIITASALVLGVSIRIGNIAGMKNKYRLMEVRFEHYNMVVGSLFLIVIAAMYFYAKQYHTIYPPL